jgi:hypothetical protein
MRFYPGTRALACRVPIGGSPCVFQLWVDQILSVYRGSIDIEPVVPTRGAQCVMEAAAYPQTRIHGQMDSSPPNPGCVLPLSRCVGRDNAAAVEGGSAGARRLSAGADSAALLHCVRRVKAYVAEWVGA